MSAAAPMGGNASGAGDTYKEQSKKEAVRLSNIVAARAVADCVRTSLGPRGMDKLIQSGNGDVVITNDGATILKSIEVLHPAGRMLVDLSASQDIEAGDGTTSVVVTAGALLGAAQKLLARGINPTAISEAFGKAVVKAEEILTGMAIPLDLADRESLIQAATTSLSSKVVSQNSEILSPIAVDAVLRVIDPATATNVDLRDIKVITKKGGTIDDTKLIDGILFNQKASHTAGGPTKITNAKIGLVQFCLSAPKTDMENSVVVSDYTQMDRILREERKYVLDICKKVQKTGCNVLLVQKSILRDAVSDLSLHFLAKMKILVVRDIERDEIEFISKTLNCRPIASVDALAPEKLGSAGLVQEISTGESKIVQITEVPNIGKTVSVLVRGSNKLVAEEAERSLHDALCVVRSLVKRRFMLPGGSAPEVEVSQRLMEYSRTLGGVDEACVAQFAEALEVIPTTLAENAGLHPIGVLTDLRNRHKKGDKYAGINVRRGEVADMLEANVIQPLLVTLSSFTLATETVRAILKIDDLVGVR